MTTSRQPRNPTPDTYSPTRRILGLDLGMQGRRAREDLFALLVVAIGSGVLGGLTSFGQTYLPSWANSLSNSCGGWTALAFLLLWAGRPRWRLAPFLGALSFELLIEGYAIVSNMRGYFYAAPFSTVWSVVGLVAGPLLGWASALVTRGSPQARAVGAAVPAAAWLGEGIYSLTSLNEPTGYAFWITETVAALTTMAVVLTRSGVSGRSALLSLALWLCGALVLCILLRASLG